jgi:lysophospholipase L1-like esterase
MTTRTIRSTAALIAACATVVALPASAPAATKVVKPTYLVALGDSYAVGYQPGRGSTTEGFNDQVVRKARSKGYTFTLANFGCGGATTKSLLKQKGCIKPARAIGGEPYTSTQTAAAVKFIKANRAQVGLVTISISGNDVTKCAKAGDQAVACVNAAKASIQTNLKSLVKQLRAAGGSKLRIVGTTYPDVILGQWVREPVNQDLAKLSIIAFQSIINPALKDVYEGAKGKFVDVTDATGAYTPLEQTTTLAPYGEIPVAVAKVCQLTWYCEKGDIHSRKSGYGVIADLIVGTLPRKT